MKNAHQAFLFRLELKAEMLKQICFWVGHILAYISTYAFNPLTMGCHNLNWIEGLWNTSREGALNYHSKMIPYFSNIPQQLIGEPYQHISICRYPQIWWIAQIIYFFTNLLMFIQWKRNVFKNIFSESNWIQLKVHPLWELSIIDSLDIYTGFF